MNKHSITQEQFIIERGILISIGLVAWIIYDSSYRLPEPIKNYKDNRRIIEKGFI